MLFITPATLLDRPDPLPPRSDTNLPLVLSVTTVLLVLSLATFALRIWVRTKKVVLLGWDDAAITLAMLLSCACWGTNLAMSIMTGGRHTWYIGLEALAHTARVSFAFVILWLWAVSMVKISVCLMLLRIKPQSRAWLIGLWLLIGLLASLAVAITACYLLQCKPVEANWDFKYLLEPGHCWTLDQFLSFTYAFSSESAVWRASSGILDLTLAGIFVLTDLICALLPVAFIWRINRPLREKITLCVIMGLGLLASCCGIMKMILLRSTLMSADPVYNAAPAQIWA